MLPVIRADPTLGPFTFGGGTALAQWLEHRVSYDIDLFFESARALRSMSPQRNPLARAALGDRWQEPGHYLKFELPHGEIDLLVTYPVCDDPSVDFEFEGYRLQLERPREILGKKIRYRAPAFKARDVFDLAATIQFAPDEVEALLPEIADRLPQLRQRIELLSADFPHVAPDAINATPKGAHLLIDAPAICLRALT